MSVFDRQSMPRDIVDLEIMQGFEKLSVVAALDTAP
jgi:hypothetical protein